LIIAEYQCDVLHRGQKEAIQDFLPLKNENWITNGNALRLDWLSVCRPTGEKVQPRSDFLNFEAKEQYQVDFENEGGETYICGNPPYLGSTFQSDTQKNDLKNIAGSLTNKWRSLDYVSGWFIKASEYCNITGSVGSFVATNSICQGEQVPILWPLVFAKNNKILFAYTSFKWSNLAKNKAGVTVVIIGIGKKKFHKGTIHSINQNGEVTVKSGANINAYLIHGPDLIVDKVSKAPVGRSHMVWGNKPTDDGNFFMNYEEMKLISGKAPSVKQFLHPFFGSAEYIRGNLRFCLWIEDDKFEIAQGIPEIQKRIELIREFRSKSKAKDTRQSASFAHRFRQIQGISKNFSLIIPRVSSERREFLPIGLLDKRAVVSDNAFALYDAPLWNMALIASRIHLVWIATVCGKLETRYRYSNTLGWNTFPIPTLTEKNKEDLTRCAEDILLAREAHFPATIADLYDSDKMPKNLREAHERNDEVLERIYIGRRFKNDTERLEKLFELYAKMTEAPQKLEFNS
jgi:hypothetical protein